MSIRFRALVCSSAFFVVATTAALAQTQTPSPAGATVYFINIKDGDAVTSPFKVQFGLTYEVVGPPSAPVLRVNPISVLAPGLFRKFFAFPTGAASPSQSYADPAR